MTAVGWHVHELTAPEVDLVVDRVAELPDGHELLRAHDADHHDHYLAAADTERHARHGLPDGTIRGRLDDPHVGNPWFDGGVR